jgi:hypothetical protein
LTGQHVSSDIIAHNQELINCNYSLEAPDDERSCRSKHVEQLRSNGIINCLTQLHLVGHFCKILKSVSLKMLNGTHTHTHTCTRTEWLSNKGAMSVTRKEDRLKTTASEFIHRLYS